MPHASNDESFMRPAAAGAGIGFVVVAAASSALVAAIGVQMLHAAALGAFVGAWGGGGLGFVLGAMYAILRAGDRQTSGVD